MILSKNDNSNIEYIIYTSNDFYEQADIIKNLYSEEVDNNMQLETQIIYSENISSENLSAYLYNIENGYVNSNDVFEKLKYLLIIGDETIIEPMYYFGHTPADDYFASKNQNTNSIPTPQLAIGRILINNPESLEHINSIRNYVLYHDLFNHHKIRNKEFEECWFIGGEKIYKEVLNKDYIDNLVVSYIP